jgi:hypothetical protein
MNKPRCVERSGTCRRTVDDPGDPAIVTDKGIDQPGNLAGREHRLFGNQIHFFDLRFLIRSLYRRIILILSHAINSAIGMIVPGITAASIFAPAIGMVAIGMTPALSKGSSDWSFRIPSAAARSWVMSQR